MVIIIKSNSHVPIYDQIKNRILDAIMSGEKKKENVSRDLKVSVITTTKAYNDLETAGYIFAVQGKGYYISERSNEIVKKKLLEEIESHFDKAILIAKKAALKETDLIAILRNLLKQEER